MSCGWRRSMCPPVLVDDERGQAVRRGVEPAVSSSTPLSKNFPDGARRPRARPRSRWSPPCRSCTDARRRGSGRPPRRRRSRPAGRAGGRSRRTSSSPPRRIAKMSTVSDLVLEELRGSSSRSACRRARRAAPCSRRGRRGRAGTPSCCRTRRSGSAEGGSRGMPSASAGRRRSARPGPRRPSRTRCRSGSGRAASGSRSAAGMRPTLWQVEQNSGVRMNGFRNVLRWSDGSMRMSSRLTAREGAALREGEGILLRFLDDVRAVARTSLTSAIEWHDMQVRPCCASNES